MPKPMSITIEYHSEHPHPSGDVGPLYIVKGDAHELHVFESTHRRHAWITYETTATRHTPRSSVRRYDNEPEALFDAIKTASSRND